MNNLIFLIGLPCSGKSGIAKDWLNYQCDIDNGNLNLDTDAALEPIEPRVVVCADDIRLAMGHRWNGHVEPMVHAIKIMMIKTLLREHNVLVDGTHTTHNSIIELLRIDPNATYYLVDTPAATCKQRAEKTNQKDLFPVIDRMEDQIRKLTHK
jgi:predicted kinase